MDVDESELDIFKRKCIELEDENASLKHENNELWKELAKALAQLLCLSNK